VNAPLSSGQTSSVAAEDAVRPEVAALRVANDGGKGRPEQEQRALRSAAAATDRVFRSRWSRASPPRALRRIDERHLVRRLRQRRHLSVRGHHEHLRAGHLRPHARAARRRHQAHPLLRRRREGMAPGRPGAVDQPGQSLGRKPQPRDGDPLPRFVHRRPRAPRRLGPHDRVCPRLPSVSCNCSSAGRGAVAPASARWGVRAAGHQKPLATSAFDAFLRAAAGAALAPVAATPPEPRSRSANACSARCLESGFFRSAW
jgi:hypothetical protein